MTVGFIMMCHTALGRAAEVARHWAEAGCPVVIHVDRRVPREDYDPLVRQLADLDSVSFSPRFACRWGTWSLVAATQAAAEQMLHRHAGVRHVYLASGACLPLRSAAELIDYLAARPQTDFIESVTTSDVVWTKGGLDRERFSLHFPFGWRSHRRLFDLVVRVQRLLKVERRLPKGVVPHLGSQWWCLSRQTLSAILQDPDRARHDRFFRTVWIPDESYFQTLARLYAINIESRSLTLSKFDFEGKPYNFYDDHLQLLRRSDCFVARKIWPHADRLYRTFLAPAPSQGMRAEPSPEKIDRLFARAVDRRMRGRPGLYMQSRYPLKDHENGKTAGPYSVFHGFSDLFEEFDLWLGRTVGGRVHGHLFAPERAEFAGGETVYNGCLSDSEALRDYNPQSFLTNLIWNTRGDRQCFQFSPRDNQACNWFMATDPNAQISVISGTWAVRLLRSNMDFADIRREAARLQRIETDHLKILRTNFVKARVRIWSMAEFLESPMEALQTVIDEIRPQAARLPAEAPRMTDLSGFGQFLQNLKNQGMQPIVMGEFVTPGDAQRADAPARSKPHVVR
ncbi:MAG: beta-1,6-N-acetylglucosaminyltransferase [Proteobacteria bacterium]|nr:beta-1,6-N-acetylglucosaminyltransferase [Pseudomonadota bacterium]